MDALTTLDEALTNQLTYLKKNDKLHSIYIKLESNSIKELFFKYGYNKKVNRQQILQKVWKNNFLTYKTERGHNSERLTSLFKIFFLFLTNPPPLLIQDSSSLMQDITKYDKPEEFNELIAEKHDLHYGYNDTDMIEISIFSLKLKLDQYVEKYGHTKPMTFSIKTSQFSELLI